MSSVAKQKSGTSSGVVGGLFAEVFRFGNYKPNQGRVVRQVTFAAVALLGCLVAWELKRSALLSGLGDAGGWGAMLGISLCLIWFAYRLVQYPLFADFLIAVEAEMNKVSWPTKKELWNASVVVMIVIFGMAMFLWVFDMVWTFVFEQIGIRYSEKGSLFQQFFGG